MVNKLALPAKENEVQSKINEIIDALGGGGSLPSQTEHAGEFLTTDGSDASWAVATKITFLEL